ncbi:riboflavin synthase subunit alpha [Haloarcula hispanica N601]|uniref:Riboflavin synthase n=3 Tax=Haloarcula hispanica TaxID=51589 RepID=V5TQB2_HALHI|nr:MULTISPECIES: riboflavin synthase [Haloarcula]AEM58386.1 riboflavin synthase subunit alpha [Haloarcula hispanica ATCC 33960]AHB67117.1 riboflavin synthase subunit alpha [Haloarcula hispanica N601]AJF25407.1 riboflavin synthase subunit alpha [Haloarcula sp. CBA1115]KAA9405970.1 riboflavin synthase [Haloarcula sp. CBA1131]KZX47100.1 riboflavin synthase subunit alpha [Haloarcula sp. K1]
MFTGIVETTGEVQAVIDDEGGRRMRIGAPFEGLDHGQSISVSGVCLTVEKAADGEWFEVFLAQETLARTFFDDLDGGDRVNLERAMPADGRFDGHIVQGHVDTTAEIVGIEQEGEDWTFTFSLPEAHQDYLVQKGSITVDGISLTVADRRSEEFDVAIIPTTYAETTLSEKSVGDPVHLEVDVVAKYVEQLV